MSNFAFNFRGTFGSGKSVVPLLMFRNTPEEEREVVRLPSSNKIQYVVIHPYKTVIVGGYEKACGGIDTFIPFTLAVVAIEAAATRAIALGYDLIMEGVILSSTLSSSLKIFEKLEDDFSMIPVPIYMNTPPERCVANVTHRNGGKGLKDGGDNINKKYRNIWVNQRPQMAEKYPIKVFKTDGIDTEGMLARFLKLQKKLHEGET